MKTLIYSLLILLAFATSGTTALASSRDEFPSCRNWKAGQPRPAGCAAVLMPNSSEWRGTGRIEPDTLTVPVPPTK